MTINIITYVMSKRKNIIFVDKQLQKETSKFLRFDH